MVSQEERSRLESFRARREEYMRTHGQSPLTETQKTNFVPPEYFPENPELVFVVEANEDISHESVPLGTTSGESKEYIPYAAVHLVIEGEPVTLTVFQEPGRGRRLLIPFKDATNGNETYGAGRTVDPRSRPDGKLVIDFNYAYGPYCQYNDNWTCTLPPFNNWLAVPIRAGEKKYPNKESEFPD